MAGKVEITSMRKYTAEFLGTLALVFFGCGSAVIAGAYIGFLGIALTFGMVLLALVYSIGPISGCHVNPAVTLAMLMTGKIAKKDATAYIGFQCLGALAGAAILFAIASGMPGWEISDGLGQNGYESGSPAGFTMMSCFIAEVFLTFFFVYIILEVTSKPTSKGFEGITIGFALFLAHIVGIPITGTSVNPARSLGPALFVGGTAMEQLWMFWAAPIAGALLAALVWMYLSNPREMKKNMRI